MTIKKEGFIYNGFTYWLDEYFEYKTVTGSKDQCIRIFNHDLQSHPIEKFGTGVRHRCYDNDGNNYRIIIRRFKTEELYLKHLNLPPTYKRQGQKID